MDAKIFRDHIWPMKEERVETEISLKENRTKIGGMLARASAPES